MTRLIYGVGVNDANYTVRPLVNGVKQICPYYSTWHGMLRRCYSEAEHIRRPTYKDCYVCEEWLFFSNFKEWMSEQDWVGKQLDKDLLIQGNRVYSPSTAVFLPVTLNSFLLDCGSRRGSCMLGVHKHRNKYQALCSNPLTKKKEHLGLFESEIDAHLAWKTRKHELACELAAMQADERVKLALTNRYI